MKRVFIVMHTHELEGELEDLKMIGAFSSRERAEAAVTKLRAQSGFRDHPNGFHIDSYEIDAVHWPEGFAAVD